MESQYISACLSNDLVQARKLFESIMHERTLDLISERKAELARSFMIEGEEPEDDESEKDESEKKDKKESDAEEDDGEEDKDED